MCWLRAWMSSEDNARQIRLFCPPVRVSRIALLGRIRAAKSHCPGGEIRPPLRYYGETKGREATMMIVALQSKVRYTLFKPVTRGVGTRQALVDVIHNSAMRV